VCQEENCGPTVALLKRRGVLIFRVQIIAYCTVDISSGGGCDSPLSTQELMRHGHDHCACDNLERVIYTWPVSYMPLQQDIAAARGLRHEPSSPAQTLGSCLRIPLEAWMPVFVLSCVCVAALRRSHPPTKESYRQCKRSRNWKTAKVQQKDCRTVYIYI
jgi:hypothetical protein